MFGHQIQAHLPSVLAMPATRRTTLTGTERSSSESSLYTASGTSYMATDSDASSSSPAPTNVLAVKQRRTRKRISQAQLNALENLFARATHPSQQEREVLAKALHMYVHFFSNHSQVFRPIILRHISDLFARAWERQQNADRRLLAGR